MNAECILNHKDDGEPFKLYGADPDDGICVMIDWVRRLSDEVYTCQLDITLMRGLLVRCSVHNLATELATRTQRTVIGADEAATIIREKIANDENERLRATLESIAAIDCDDDPCMCHFVDAAREALKGQR